MKNSWISFLRKYGPIPQNDNMYDETIQKTARRYKISPIEFEHPLEKEVLECFTKPDPAKLFHSVILTGTAGDGKTHLCRKVWKAMKGDQDLWTSDDPYLKLKKNYVSKKDSTKTPVTIHFIRDLSAWTPQQGYELDLKKEKILHTFCRSLYDPESKDIFLIAGNDGQLIETLRHLKENEDVLKVRSVIEDLLVEDKKTMENVRLILFNLSRGNSSTVFQKAIDAFLSHPGWDESYNLSPGENDFFGPKCPIRNNYELLKTPLVQSRLKSLIKLCEYNDHHIPLRQMLLLLTNAVLGHPEVRDRLMIPNDIPRIIENDSVSKANLYNNIFGGNLTNRRTSITVFEYFDRFQIGFETSNRIDNILIFGDGDPNFQEYYDQFVQSDQFYGADSNFHAAKQEYLEGNNEDETSHNAFLQLLVSQRRGLFFKIPEGMEDELNLWELTVFKYAGEYLNDVIKTLIEKKQISNALLLRLIKGLNRIFTGMLIDSDREIFLATSGNYSQAKICRILIDKISVKPSKGEKISIFFDSDTKKVYLSVQLSPEIIENFELNLTRFEFLSRIAKEGALPASFSRECYEDFLAFKTQLLAAQRKREKSDDEYEMGTIDLRILTLSSSGKADDVSVEVIL